MKIHSKRLGDDAMFTRIDEAGTVRIRLLDRVTPYALEITMRADVWASVVAAVSRRGDTAETCQDARMLHDLEPDPPARDVEDLVAGDLAAEHEP